MREREINEISCFSFVKISDIIMDYSILDNVFYHIFVYSFGMRGACSKMLRDWVIFVENENRISPNLLSTPRLFQKFQAWKTAMIKFIIIVILSVNLFVLCLLHFPPIFRGKTTWFTRHIHSVFKWKSIR